MCFKNWHQLFHIFQWSWSMPAIKSCQSIKSISEIQSCFPQLWQEQFQHSLRAPCRDKPRISMGSLGAGHCINPPEQTLKGGQDASCCPARRDLHNHRAPKGVLSKSLWSALNWFQLVWTRFDRFEQVYMGLIWFKPVWSELNRTESVQTSLNWIKLVQTGSKWFKTVQTSLNHLDRFDSAWTGLEQFVWSGLIPFELFF